MSMPSKAASQFLQIIQDEIRKQNGGGQNTRPTKWTLLGTIDPSYGGGNPKIVFDDDPSRTPVGPYPFAASYSPAAGDRVILLRTGNSGKYVILGTIGSKPTGAHAPGGVATYNALSIVDTRAVATTPSTYGSESAWNFKETSAIGLPSSAGTYAAVEGIAPWNDDSGGGNFEIAYTENGAIYVRFGARASGWGAWSCVTQTPGNEVQVPAWQYPSYENGWEDYTGGGIFVPSRYVKDAVGRVQIEGLLTVPSAPSANQVIFQLPVGFRPSITLIFPAIQSDGIYELRVTNTGDVTCGNVAATAGAWVSLSSISFYAEQ